MRHEIIMPALGMAQDTGKLVTWHKSEGDAVAQGETLFEAETDKSIMDIEAPASGFLVGVSAGAGEDVPVGQVIALISDTADTPPPNPESTKNAHPSTQEGDSEPEPLPQGQAIIMPVLGMSQDTGTLVGWHKALGDEVAQDDILFEVETDKSVVDVPAGTPGYLVARLATDGDNVPTGETIAIIAPEPINNMVDRGYSSPKKELAEPAPSKALSETEKPATHTQPASSTHKRSVLQGKILASPKLKRMAHQAGYDLALLAETGSPQPFHERDFDALKQAHKTFAKDEGPAPANDRVSKLSARVPAQSFADFLDWAKDQVEPFSDARVIASFVGSGLADNSVIRINTQGNSVNYATGPQLSETLESSATATLVVHDLRGTFITSASIKPESTPVMAITSFQNELTLILTCTPTQLTGEAAAGLLDNFAGRLADPLRHLF